VHYAVSCIAAQCYKLGTILPVFPLTYLIKMPPPQRVKDFVKDLGRVFAVRLRHFKKKGPSQRSSTTTDHNGDGSIHVQIPSAFSFPSQTLSSLLHSASSKEPGLESSTDVPPARHSGGVSLAREASDMAQLALPLMQAVASAIPLVGAPMQAAIDGLLTGLQAIDVRVCMIASTFLIPKFATET
jgi:hypothetical protein